MIPRSCITIETSKFPILEGEDEELLNERMYGKALCRYLESKLPALGIRVPSFNNEDWGWWLEVEQDGFAMALCIYSDPDATSHPQKYALLPSIREPKRWSWSKFRHVDVSGDVLRVVDLVDRLFRNDSEIKVVERHDDFPF